MKTKATFLLIGFVSFLFFFAVLPIDSYHECDGGVELSACPDVFWFGGLKVLYVFWLRSQNPTGVYDPARDLHTPPEWTFNIGDQEFEEAVGRGVLGAFLSLLVFSGVYYYNKSKNRITPP